MTVLNQQILHRKAYDIISDKFGEGFNGQIPMLINVKDKKDDPQGLQQDLQSVYKDIKDKKNVDITCRHK